MNFSIQSNYYIFAVLLVLVFALASMFYHRRFQRSSFQKKERIALLILRIFSLSLLVLFLFGPSFRWWSNKEIKPELAVVFDNSHSMISGIDSIETRSELDQFSTLLEKGLSDKFDLSIYRFDSQIQDSADIDYSGYLSNYASVIDYFVQDQSHSNLVSTIIVGDGIYNRGANPLNRLDAMDIPIFAVAHGDSSVYKDALVQEMFSPEIAFVDRPFSLGVQIQQRALDGRNAILSLFESGKLIEKRQLIYNSREDFFEETFEVTPHKTGFVRYSAAVTLYDDEVNKQNNQQSLTLEIRDNRQKVLMLYSSTHPDIGAIRRSLDRLGEYDIQLESMKTWNGQLEGIDLLFVHQTNAATSTKWISKLKASTIPTFFIFGDKITSNLLSNFQGSVVLKNQDRRGEKTTPVYNHGFSTFSIDNTTVDFLSSLPPLSSPYGRWSVDKNCSSLFYQSVQGVATDFPLWVFCSGKKKEALLLGEGLWRWSVYDYLMGGSFQRFDALMELSISYLLLKENRDHLHVSYEKKVEEYDDIVFESEVFDDVYAYVKDAEVVLKITNQENEEFDYGLLPKGNRYGVNLGRFSPGDYSFVVEALSKDETYKKKGKFVVVESRIEEQQLKAKFDLMRTMAYKTNGLFFDRNNPAVVENLVDSLEKRYQSSYKKEVQQKVVFLLDEESIMVLIVLCLALEWALRKYFGQM